MKCYIHNCELTSQEVQSNTYHTTMIEPEYTEVYFCEECFDEYSEGKRKSYKMFNANDLYDVDNDIKSRREVT